MERIKPYKLSNLYENITYKSNANVYLFFSGNKKCWMMTTCHVDEKVTGSYYSLDEHMLTGSYYYTTSLDEHMLTESFLMLRELTS